jgi:ABC-type antimicrobial peptide transport system permease subunit
MSSLLLRDASLDAATFAAVTLLLWFVAFLSNYLLARHAARVDPIIALRCE